MASHNSFSFIDGQKSLISNIRNVYKCLLGMLLNQFITLSVFFHSFTFVSSDKVLFIFCNMCLLILPISFFAGFNNLAVGQFKTFSLWSFNVMKLLLVKIFNKNPIKLSYSCKPNIGSKINGHNKKILQPKPAEPQKLCN